MTAYQATRRIPHRTAGAWIRIGDDPRLHWSRNAHVRYSPCLLVLPPAGLRTAPAGMSGRDRALARCPACRRALYARGERETRP